MTAYILLESVLLLLASFLGVSVTGLLIIHAGYWFALCLLVAIKIWREL